MFLPTDTPPISSRRGVSSTAEVLTRVLRLGRAVLITRTFRKCLIMAQLTLPSPPSQSDCHRRDHREKIAPSARRCMVHVIPMQATTNGRHTTRLVMAARQRNLEPVSRFAHSLSSCAMIEKGEVVAKSLDTPPPHPGDLALVSSDEIFMTSFSANMLLLQGGITTLDRGQYRNLPPWGGGGTDIVLPEFQNSYNYIFSSMVEGLII